jgi:trk system potassium uptake protein TrkH
MPSFAFSGPSRPLRWIRAFFQTPSRIPVTGFLFIILTGTLLLKLPWATYPDLLSWTDAFFTATSATCVTGLVVLDTAETFTPLGRGIVLMLIQIGGVGTMTLSTLILMAAGRRPGIRDRNLLQDTFTHGTDKSPARIVSDVLRLTLVVEALGALGLFIRFLWDMPPSEALGHAVFHSISAFCNAGFALFPDSLVAYRQDKAVNLIVAALIITGGFGFLAIAEIRDQIRTRPQRLSRLSLHTRLVLSVTLILLFSGTLLFFLMESRNTLSSMGPGQSLMASFFQSATLRTAGFNTLPFEQMTSVTLFACLVFMFIGGSPGSCAGGVKTTTAATLFLLGLARLQGRERPQIFYRSIPEASITRAMSVFLLSLFVIGLAIMGLLITESHALPHPESKGLFLEIAFEATSAFATVGLSTGLTPSLSVAGKWIVIFLMFTGRVGPLVLAVAISRKSGSRFRYAEEPIMIG